MRPFVICEPGVSEKPSGPRYGLPGGGEWPRLAGANLGPAGAWNALWRLGLVPIAGDGRSRPQPDRGDTLFACASGPLRPELTEVVAAWLAAGRAVVATGAETGWGRFLPGCELEAQAPPHPYAGLAYLLPPARPELVAPPGWRYLRARVRSRETRAEGTLGMVHGERQTPGRALVTPLEAAPASLRAGRFLYLNGDPFAALQAWVQGQEDLGPWMAWRQRFFWLDELAAFLGRLLEASGAIPPASERRGIPGLASTTIVLRHDLDASRDTAYLEEELARGLPAVHAILKDGNTAFWVKRLKACSGHETALHYNTLSSSWIGRRLEAFSASAAAHRPARREIAGPGLLRQVRWARSHGITVGTLHRHGAFLLYPEWIDALQRAFEAEPEALGGSSLFRSQVLRFGADRVDGARGTVAEFPDSQFPFWLPFRLAHAARRGQMLRGWETTSVMEIEPELFEQMLDHVVAGLPQRVFTLNFHPAHARRPTFAPAGSLPAFRRILDVIREGRFDVRVLSEVYRICNRVAALGSGRA